MKSFALIGAAGYIAPRHLKAIKATDNALVAAYDPFDSVGIMDSYFPNAAFFTEFERFDRHIEKNRQRGKPVDYVSICSPNYLHDAHIRFALRNGAHAVCEKPLVLNPWNVDYLSQLEAETGMNIYTILQLRHHPTILALKEEIESGPSDKVYDVDLSYITSRGNWYYTSWKGDMSKSGGICTNIGIHFFDVLQWIFGEVTDSKVFQNSHDRSSGFLQLKRARVKWFLSINADHLPADAGRTYRSIKIDSRELEFSEGFEDLHTTSYKSILEGKGFRIHDARPSIELVHNVRTASLDAINEDAHPLAQVPQSEHPFGAN